jgi:hypothetical protein
MGGIARVEFERVARLRDCAFDVALHQLLDRAVVVVVRHQLALGDALRSMRCHDVGASHIHHELSATQPDPGVDVGGAVDRAFFLFPAQRVADLARMGLDACLVRQGEEKQGETEAIGLA